MARAKQRAPLQRETSKRMENWRDSNALPKAQANGHSKEGVDRGGGGEGGRGAAVQMPQDSPGVVQLLICVGGIYASLYAPDAPDNRLHAGKPNGDGLTADVPSL